ncbi:MAG: tRNA uracil 4-sulfurtransferase ThiI, partial [Candidatus Syntropharchaeia archaeon]
MILVRPSSEIWLKSESVRKKWEKVLVERIRAYGYRIRGGRGRLWIEDDLTPEQQEILKKTFGIDSFSICERCDLKELEKYVLDFWERKGIRKGSFAVRVKRVGEHTFTSKEMEARLGSIILERYSLSVDLDSPDYTLYVEIRNGDCYIFDEIVKAVGGLPYGVEGKVVGLFSGGIDSPVAMWMMMRRGCEVIPVYFDMFPFSDRKKVEKVEKVAEVLREYQQDFRVRIVKHGNFLLRVKEVLFEKGFENYICILCKRRMYAVAEEIAMNEGAKGIVTGESLGQVASQTLDNLYVLESAVSLPVYRPLIGMNKLEIEGIARSIGTYELSISFAEE